MSLFVVFRTISLGTSIVYNFLLLHTPEIKYPLHIYSMYALDGIWLLVVSGVIQ